MASKQVRVYEDLVGSFHYQVFLPGSEDNKLNPTICGLSIIGMKTRAWFRVGDSRGGVHYERACESCREGMKI